MTPDYIPPQPKPKTLYELRYDGDEYYWPLGLFETEAAAKAAWDRVAEKINEPYRGDYMIAKVTLYRVAPEQDVIDVMINEVGDHNEDATAFLEQDDQGEEDSLSPDEEPSPPSVSPGQTDLPL